MYNDRYIFVTSGFSLFVSQISYVYHVIGVIFRIKHFDSHTWQKLTNNCLAVCF